MLLLIVCGTGYVYRDAWMPEGDDADAIAIAPGLTTDRPENGPLDGGPNADVTERGSDPLLTASPTTPRRDIGRSTDVLAAARRVLADGDLILARAHFSEALAGGLSPTDEIEARAGLRKLGQQTIFSNTVTQGDPFTARYVIAPGDTLGKIANAHDVTADFIAAINNIKDMHMIQAGRRIKVVQGPFHARVTKSTHTMDVFCGDVFVDHFKVGLGVEDGTPTGTWTVSTKLKNPTYYPPRGGDMIAADDSLNPLGERWIGLEGIGGEAIGQSRYGIHGTIEPDSIGKDASMGCIRMHNEDVERLFSLLIEKKSVVEIRE